MQNDVLGIRRLIGPMPFDRDGFHATGREVLMPSLAFEGQNSWYYEYEDWDTVNLDTTETDEEYEVRCEEYCYGCDEREEEEDFWLNDDLDFSDDPDSDYEIELPIDKGDEIVIMAQKEWGNWLFGEEEEGGEDA